MILVQVLVSEVDISSCLDTARRLLAVAAGPRADAAEGSPSSGLHLLL